MLGVSFAAMCSRAVQYFLCLFAGEAAEGEYEPEALGEDEVAGEGVKYTAMRQVECARYERAVWKRGEGGGKRTVALIAPLFVVVVVFFHRLKREKRNQRDLRRRGGKFRKGTKEWYAHH